MPLHVEDGNGNDVTNAPTIAPYFTYTGREWDVESGLYYYRARSYDAEIGRFLQVDPHAGALSLTITINNRYIYGNNNPTQFNDPQGEIADNYKYGNYCGLSKKAIRGQRRPNPRPKNNLDRACWEHDLAYGEAFDKPWYQEDLAQSKADISLAISALGSIISPSSPSEFFNGIIVAAGMTISTIINAVDGVVSSATYGLKKILGI